MPTDVVVATIDLELCSSRLFGWRCNVVLRAVALALATVLLCHFWLVASLRKACIGLLTALCRHERYFRLGRGVQSVVRQVIKIWFLSIAGETLLVINLRSKGAIFIGDIAGGVVVIS